MIRKQGKLISVNWEEAFSFIKTNLKDIKNIQGIVGKLVDSETLLVFKDFLTKLNSPYIQVGEEPLSYKTDFRHQYLMNTKLTDIKNADCCVLVGSNPRLESPLLNIRLRKQFLKKENFFVYIFGPAMNLTYYSYQISNNMADFVKFCEGIHPISRVFSKAKNPLLNLM